MTLEQWMKEKNIANYGPHLEPIIRLTWEAAWEARGEAFWEAMKCELCDAEGEHMDGEGIWLCRAHWMEATNEASALPEDQKS